MSESSGLAFIKVKNSKDPFSLFREWLKEVDPFVNKPILMNLATASKNGQVSNRNVVLRDFLNDGGLVVLTTKSKSSRKFKDISENPQVAACFIWQYQKNGKLIDRQVRFEGVAEILPDEITQPYYACQPFFCKIRSRLCQQGEIVDWDDLKIKHENLVQDSIDGTISLTQMADDQIGFKIVATKADFYYAYDDFIGDRVVFVKSDKNSNEKWTSHHVAA